jgi:hypothetical protein
MTGGGRLWFSRAGQVAGQHLVGRLRGRARGRAVAGRAQRLELDRHAPRLVGRQVDAHVVGSAPRGRKRQREQREAGGQRLCQGAPGGAIDP